MGSGMKAFFLFQILIFLIFSPSSVQADENFHPPQTEAERTLDNILWRSSNDGNLEDYVMGTPGRKKAHDGEYRTLITGALARSMRQYFHKLCDGPLTDDNEPCFDANPLTLTQDDEGHFYHTETQSPDAALIFAVYAEQDPKYGHIRYRLVRKDHRWMLDGINDAGCCAFHLR